MGRNSPTNAGHACVSRLNIGNILVESVLSIIETHDGSFSGCSLMCPSRSLTSSTSTLIFLRDSSKRISSRIGSASFLRASLQQWFRIAMPLLPGNRCAKMDHRPPISRIFLMSNSSSSSVHWLLRMSGHK